jgi:hypothetical protein
LEDVSVDVIEVQPRVRTVASICSGAKPALISDTIILTRETFLTVYSLGGRPAAGVRCRLGLTQSARLVHDHILEDLRRCAGETPREHLLSVFMTATVIDGVRPMFGKRRGQNRPSEPCGVNKNPA